MPASGALLGAAGPARYDAGVTDGFLDVRRHGFARVAVCVPAVRVADPAFNRDAHLAQLGAAYERGVRYAVCPELGLSSYTCGDLFFQARLLDASLDALAALADATRTWNLAFSVGNPLSDDGAL
jgi:NAD+ synthase (glutamine-hydrolysing)